MSCDLQGNTNKKKLILISLFLFVGSASLVYKSVVTKFLPAPHMSLRGHKARVLALVFSLDGKMMASGGLDKKMKLWDAHAGRVLYVFDCEKAVSSIVFSADGNNVAYTVPNGDSMGSSFRLNMVDTKTGILIWTAVKLQGSEIAFLSGGKALIASGIDGLNLYNIRTGKILKKFTTATPPFSISPDDKTLAASYGMTAIVKLWSVKTGVVVHTLILPDNVRSSTSSIESGGGDDYMWVRGLSFSCDSRILAVANGGRQPGVGNLILWKRESGDLYHVLQKNSSVHSVVLSPNCTNLASISAGGVVRIWNIKTGKLSHDLSHRRWPLFGSVTDFKFSNDGKHLVSASANGVLRLWDAGNWTEQSTLGGEGYCAAFSPNNETLSGGGEDGMIRIWKIQ